MIPVIAIVGRQNVGKSTLFNTLISTNKALVTENPGFTRDRQYGIFKYKNHSFILIDTGGINFLKKEIQNYVIKQSILAIKEADIILFVVDGKYGISFEDFNIANQLRKEKKNVIVVVNKVNNIDFNVAISDFYSLGFKNIVSISSSKNSIFNNLLKNTLIPLIKNSFIINNKNKNYEEEMNFFLKKIKNKHDLKSLPIKLAIVGRPNVGKSMLINCILSKNRVIVYNDPGTTRDSIYIPMLYNNNKYILIDTAGISKRKNILEKMEKFSIIKTFQAIEDSNIVVLVIDFIENILNQDLSLLNYILKRGRSLVIAVNKCDIFSKKEQLNIKNILNKKLCFVNFIKIHFISALYNKGIKHLFQSIKKSYLCSIKKISSSLLTKILEEAIYKHKPPIVNNYRIKPKFAHAGGYNPLIIVIHGNKVKKTPDNYIRYLKNYFHNSLSIIGSPIKIKFNEPINPFIYKHKTSIKKKF